MAESDNQKSPYSIEPVIIQVGSILKSPLTISNGGIEWKKRKWDLDNIDKIRWGATKLSSHSYLYYVSFGDPERETTIEVKNREDYEKFINSLWNSVGNRLLVKFLQNMAGGKTYHFGSWQKEIIEDRGVRVPSKSSTSPDDYVLHSWSSFQFGGQNGKFIIYSMFDEKVSCVWDYKADNNIHVLESAIKLYRQEFSRLQRITGERVPRMSTLLL